MSYKFEVRINPRHPLRSIKGLMERWGLTGRDWRFENFEDVLVGGGGLLRAGHGALVGESSFPLTPVFSRVEV
ncbi:MAG: hypothetical protein OEY59_11985 [Deltaproteobacteria bacterium]|nr:hypothetical protein [Deltaproteobacteria bacterium]